MAKPTRDELEARVYALLGESSDVEEFDSTEVVLPKIEDVITRICKGEFLNVATGQRYRSWYLPFLDKTVFYTGVKEKSLSADVATTDTEVDFTATDFTSASAEDPQYVLINWDIIKYEWKSSTQITWVTGIDTTHSSGDLVYQLHKVPSSINKPYNLWKVTETNRMEKVDFCDFRKPITKRRYFTIVRDQTNDVDLINIVWYGADKFMLIYVDKNTTLSNGSSECIIPDSLELVSHLVAWEILREYEEYEDWQTKINHWCHLLDEMYAFYAKQTKESDQRITTGNPINLNLVYPSHGKGWSYRYK